MEYRSDYKRKMTISCVVQLANFDLTKAYMVHHGYVARV